MAEFAYNIFLKGDDRLLAIADSTLLEKTFEEGDRHITVSKQFYGDKTCGREEAKKLIMSATIINAVGKEIIGLMIEENIADKENILTIEGVPHAQVVSL